MAKNSLFNDGILVYHNPDIPGFSLFHPFFWWTTSQLVGGWTNLSSKICERQIGSFPQVRMEIKNIWGATNLAKVEGIVHLQLRLVKPFVSSLESTGESPFSGEPCEKTLGGKDLRIRFFNLSNIQLSIGIFAIFFHAHVLEALNSTL